jgi:hypothetical protein
MRAWMVPLALLLLVPVVATPASAGPSQRISMFGSLDADESALDGQGRLPPETALHIDLRTTVVTPPVTGLCPFSTITVLFKIVQRPSYSTVTLSPSTVTKTAPLLPGTQVDGYDTKITIVQGPQAPTGQASQYVITATAVPGGSLLSGCNLSASEPLAFSYVVING